jgi:hypothetical protein
MVLAAEWDPSDQRNHFAIIADGHGGHWPDVDEDLSVEGMFTEFLHQAPGSRRDQPRMASLPFPMSLGICTKAVNPAPALRIYPLQSGIPPFYYSVMGTSFVGIGASAIGYASPVRIR